MSSASVTVLLRSYECSSRRSVTKLHHISEIYVCTNPVLFRFVMQLHHKHTFWKTLRKSASIFWETVLLRVNGLSQSISKILVCISSSSELFGCLFLWIYKQMKISIHLDSVREIVVFQGLTMEALLPSSFLHGFASLEHLNLYSMWVTIFCFAQDLITYTSQAVA